LWQTKSLSFTQQLYVFTWLSCEWKQVLHLLSLSQWLGYGAVRCLRWFTSFKIWTYSNFGSKYTASSVWKRLCLYFSPFPSVVLTQYISAPLKSFKLCTNMSKAFSCSSICKHHIKCRHRTYMQQQAVVLSSTLLTCSPNQKPINAVSKQALGHIKPSIFFTPPHPRGGGG
jgi:hypothetical protein